MISLILRDLGLETVEAEDAEVALRELQGRQASLMIVDVRLPGMQGTELVQEVKQGTPSDPAVILISAHGEPRSHLADRFLPKPFDIDDLSVAVSELLDRPT